MSNTAKLALGLFVAFGAIRVIDFIFYGQQMRDLLAGTGLLLIAYGIYKNGFRSTDFHTAGSLRIDRRHGVGACGNCHALLAVSTNSSFKPTPIRDVA
ncbi:hypothetical protein CNR27_01170 [Luteimonas chenhongjianii]|uniref:Uncharacterized protein n=1 Tax=Luteimonas chenhongjianii TaxID=2006110 RepID=A0A290XAV1_9GAMM|nr:hypothetical protein [Luteimonas chenhongjianii]ATD66229.1 hypothetical protein CNR27_01170 [Luteimonas chenhongjianii]